MVQRKLRFAKPAEAEQIVDWLHASDYNEYNPDTLNSSSLRIFCSYDDSGPQQYILLNKVLMLDSSAPKPGLDKLVAAQSFRDFTKAALLLASAEGLREVYALDCRGGLDKMAHNNHFKLIGKEVDGKFEPYRVYRITV